MTSDCKKTRRRGIIILDGDIMGIGKFVRAAREKAGLNQKQLADLVGVSQQQISKYENDTQDMPVSMLQKISDALNCRMSTLLGED